MVKRRRDLSQQFVANDAVAKLDSCRESFRVGAAVAFDDNAVQSEKNAAVGTARVDSLSQLAKGGTREQIANARAERTAHRVPYVFAHLARGALGGLQCDVAGEAFGHDHIDLAAADIVAFDKA